MRIYGMKIKIGFFTVMLALSLIISRSLFMLMALLAALLHELGHIIMAKACRIRLTSCKIGLYGAGLMPDGMFYSYTREIFLCAAGPLTNLLCGSIGLNIYKAYPSQPLLWFIFSSFILGCVNLLPIHGFDGGRIFSAIISRFISPSAANVSVHISSFVFLFILWSFSVYLLMRAGASLSLFIFSLSVFVRIFMPNG